MGRRKRFTIICLLNIHVRVTSWHFVCQKGFHRAFSLRLRTPENVNSHEFRVDQYSLTVLQRPCRYFQADDALEHLANWQQSDSESLGQSYGLYLDCVLNNIPLRALIDTGSTISLFHPGALLGMGDLKWRGWRPTQRGNTTSTGEWCQDAKWEGPQSGGDWPELSPQIQDPCIISLDLLRRTSHQETRKLEECWKNTWNIDFHSLTGSR